MVFNKIGQEFTGTREERMNQVSALMIQPSVKSVIDTIMTDVQEHKASQNELLSSISDKSSQHQVAKYLLEVNQFYQEKISECIGKYQLNEENPSMSIELHDIEPGSLEHELLEQTNDLIGDALSDFDLVDLSDAGFDIDALNDMDLGIEEALEDSVKIPRP